MSLKDKAGRSCSRVNSPAALSRNCSRLWILTPGCNDGMAGFKIFRRSSRSFPTTKVYEHDDGPSMEKFTKFRDPGTGIAPFLPIAPGNRTLFILPIELALCVIRVPLILMILGLEALLVEGIGEICLRKTVPWLLGWIRWLFLRTILLLCGIWWVDEQLDGVSKSYDPFFD